MTSMNKEQIALSSRNLEALKSRLSVPAYERSKRKVNIVHLGLGAFHRSHFANYMHMFFEKNPTMNECGIFGVGTMPADKALVENLVAQDCLYTLVEMDEAATSGKIIGSIVGAALAPQNPQLVIDRIADADTRIVSLTVTEWGYYTNPETKKFDLQHADIQHDLGHPEAPKTAMGLILYGLAKRKELNHGSLTVMSCDNLHANGQVIGTAVLAMAEVKSSELAAWIKANISFPSSMVDRITPVTTDKERAFITEKFGIIDNCPVKCEPFIQWIVEDNFVTGRPQLESVGVQYVKDVEPYEMMKVRLLNAAHSALAYPGLLFDYEHVEQVMQDADVKAYVRAFMDEITPTLAPVPGIDLTKYKDMLISRFSNPEIGDQLSRIGLNGSLKFPPFLFAGLQDNLEKKRPVIFASIALAAWLFYLEGNSVTGKFLTINDANADNFKHKDAAAILNLVLPEGPVFAAFKKLALERLHEIKTKGLRETLRAALVKATLLSMAG